jgi:23S rRNA (guanosine2251-2'-O)-methyltransferase
MSELEPHYAATPLEERIEIERNPVHIVLDNIRSAFNVGSIFRTSDAGAVAHIHLCGMTAHPPHKKLEKTALGAFEYVPWTYHERTTDCLRQLGVEGVHRVAIEVSDEAIDMHEFEWPQPSAIVFGNEVTGINDRVMKHCDSVVKIPMLGYKNSMNVATAYGVVLYDILAKWKAL